MQPEKIHDFGSCQLIFGLKWQPLSGQLNTQQIKHMSKQQKAKAWVVAGHTFMSLGLSSSRKPNKKAVYAAAVCYAFLYPKGWHASIYQLNEQQYWLAVVHEGTPMSLGDVLFDDEQTAQAALLALTQQYPELPYTEQVHALNDFLALIATHSLQKATLHFVSASSWRLVLLGCLLLGALYWWHREPEPEQVLTTAPEVDSYLAVWQQKKPLPHGKAALKQLLKAWEQIPLQLQDWQLHSAQCDGNQTAEYWLCQMRYDAVSQMATVQQVESLLPVGWRIQDSSMQSVVLEHRIDFPHVGSQWRSAEQVRLQLLSQLQHIRPAFSVLSLADPSVLASGARMTASSRYAPIFSQSLRFEGPLRSFVLLLDLDEALHWQRFALTYQPQRQPSLKSSALQVSLQGVIYVRN